MEKPTAETHELEAVLNRTGIWDLTITELANGTKHLLVNDGGMTSAVIFEEALVEILGSREVVNGIYINRQRPKITESQKARIRNAYASSFDH